MKWMQLWQKQWIQTTKWDWNKQILNEKYKISTQKATDSAVKLLK